MRIKTLMEQAIARSRRKTLFVQVRQSAIEESRTTVKELIRQTVRTNAKAAWLSDL